MYDLCIIVFYFRIKIIPTGKVWGDENHGDVSLEKFFSGEIPSLKYYWER